MDISPDEERPGQRWLGVLRLSRDADIKDSLVRHRADIEKHVSALGGVIVGWAEDPDVSASTTTPFQRPQLGDWLENRLDEFDGVIVWKLDRIVRSANHLRTLLDYFVKRNKRLVSVKEAVIDFDPGSKDRLKSLVCDLFMTIVVMVAEMEADNIRTRVLSAKEHLRANAYWPGGRVPFGFTLVEGTLPGAPIRGKVLTPVPDLIDVIRRMAELVLTEGKNISSVARTLTAEGVPPPGKGQNICASGHTAWYDQTVKAVLTNPALIGEHHRKGKVVWGADGSPVEFCKPVFPVEYFERLQAALVRPPKQRSNSKLFLSGTVECLGCGGPLYVLKAKGAGGNNLYYYRCVAGNEVKRGEKHPCLARTMSITAQKLHGFLDDQIGERFSEFELYEDVFVEGVGSFEEAERIRRSIEILHEDRIRGEYDAEPMKSLYYEKMGELRQRLAALEESGAELSRWERRPTGRTLWDAWETADWTTRKKLLDMAGLAVRALPGAGTMEIIESEDTAKRLAEYAAGKPLRSVPKPPPTARVQQHEKIRQQLITGVSQQPDQP